MTSMRAAVFSQAMALTLLAGCSTLPQSYSASCAEIPPPRIEHSADGKTARATLDVLTYNIEGLPWPARKGRAPYLKRIGEKLAALRAAGTGPDIVMFQEMFSGAASRSVVAAGYPALAAGPTRTQKRSVKRTPVALPGKRRWKKGETGIHFETGGLAIVSRYPIETEVAEPFGKGRCAGFDCLSNKGVLLASIIIPGLPDRVDLFNTHMNSQGASRVGVERRDAAHEVQADELSEFMREAGDASRPTLLAGDFNMRGSDVRFQAFRPLPRLTLVHGYCLEKNAGCDVRMTWDGDAPWMDTQDLQFFASGARVHVRPVRVEAMFDGRPDSPVLSDHDGFRVLYELSWPVAATAAAAAGCGAAVQPIASRAQ